MKLVNLGKNNSLFNTFLAEIRDVTVQSDRMRFRRNLERLGEVFAYEISKKLKYDTVEVHTPLGSTETGILTDQPVLAAILRAALPLHQGLLNYYDEADNAFVSAYRKHSSPTDFEIKVEYASCPDITGRTLIVADPMLATGGSMSLATQLLVEEFGEPEAIHLVSAIASAEGVEFMKQEMGSNVTLWVGAIDDELTAQAYIVPGLGDAGDLAFGKKE